jgi:predicted porin
MKKTLVALAALASIGSAFAADAVTLTPYVNFDAGLGVTTYGGAKDATGATKIDQGLAPASYYGSTGFGLNGSADIGSGLKAVANVEGRFSIADGAQGDAGKLFGAAANAGVAGGFGTITAGLNWSPFDSAWGTDALEYNGFSAVGAAYNTEIHADNGTSSHGSVRASILYVSPAFSGVTVSAMYAPQVDKTATTDATTYYGFGVSYANGPLSVNLGTEHISTLTNGGPATKPDEYTDAYIIGAAYNLGALTVDASMKTSKVNGDDGNGNTGTGKDTGFGVGAAYALSDTDKLAVGIATDKVTADGTSDDGKTNSFGIQYTKALSKNAKIYAGARKTDKTYVSTTTSYTTNLYAAGIRFSF